MYVSRGLRWNMEHREAFYSEREYQAACHMAYKYELARKADNKRLNQTADREPENLHSGEPEISNKPEPKNHMKHDMHRGTAWPTCSIAVCPTLHYA